MKLFLVESHTNYGCWTMVIAAKDESEAKRIAENNGAWDGYELVELVTPINSGVVWDGDVMVG